MADLTTAEAIANWVAPSLMAASVTENAGVTWRPSLVQTTRGLVEGFTADIGDTRVFIAEAYAGNAVYTTTLQIEDEFGNNILRAAVNTNSRSAQRKASPVVALYNAVTIRAIATMADSVRDWAAQHQLHVTSSDVGLE